MRVLLWIAALGLIVILFAGDKVRGYFRGGTGEVAQLNDPGPDRTAKRGTDTSSGSKTDTEQSASPGAYAPSPADAPELYESPTRRLGF